MVNTGRIDIFIFPREGICTAKQLGMTSIKVLEPPVEQNPAYHYLNKRHRALVPRLAKVLQDMAHDGTTLHMQQESLKELKKSCY
jgi:polar amino acid transport system substrate-binding protein